MNILTVLRSDCVDGLNLWGPTSAAPDDVDIIYEFCPDCYAIHASNQIS